MLITNALIVPGHDGRCFAGWLSVGADGRISGLGEGAPPAAVTAESATTENFDAGGAFVGPGFVSAHSHLFTSGVRGIAASSTLYPWVSRMSEMYMACEPDDTYWLTLHGALDHLSSGITTVYNFTQSRVFATFDYASSTLVQHRVLPNEFMYRQIDGVADSGMRFVNSARLDDEQLPENDALQAFSDVVGYREIGGTYFGTSVFGAVQWSSAPITAEREKAMMLDHGITNQAHFVETAEQIAVQQSKFDWYDAAGVLGPDFAFGHFVHPTDRMVERTAESGTSMVWQPTSNGRLGSGIADVPRYREAGIRIGIGNDDQSCTDISDPWQNMRMGLYTQRAKYQNAGVLTPAEVLRWHTLGSAEVMGVAADVGSLEVGKYADLVVVDPRKPDIGPIWDPIASYVLACGLRNLAAVYIGGKQVFADQAHTAGRDLAAEASAQVHGRMPSIAAASGFSVFGH